MTTSPKEWVKSKPALHRRARNSRRNAQRLLHYAKHGHVPRRRMVEHYLESTDKPRLQIGAGRNGLPGWLNSDWKAGEVYLDVTRPLPFPDGSFAFAFAEHLIEHVHERHGNALMAELYRVLRPGGVLRLTTPELPKLVALYGDRSPAASREEYREFLSGASGIQVDSPCQVFNQIVRGFGHQYVYDEDELAARLRAAGFDDVQRRESGESPHEELRGVERHGDWVNRVEAMCLEATRH